MIQAKPPKLIRLHPFRDEPPNGLIHRSRLADATRSENQLKPVRGCLQSMSQMLYEWSFHLERQGVGHMSQGVPRVLFREQAPVVSTGRLPGWFSISGHSVMLLQFCTIVNNIIWYYSILVLT